MICLLVILKLLVLKVFDHFAKKTLKENKHVSFERSDNGIEVELENLEEQVALREPTIFDRLINIFIIVLFMCYFGEVANALEYAPCEKYSDGTFFQKRPCLVFIFFGFSIG